MSEPYKAVVILGLPKFLPLWIYDPPDDSLPAVDIHGPASRRALDDLYQQFIVRLHKLGYDTA